MNNTLHTSRCVRRPFSARTTLAAALVALACGGCALDQPLAGLGSIFGAPAEAKTAAGRRITGDINTTNAQRFLHGGAIETNSVFGEKYAAQGKDKYVLVEARDFDIKVFVFAKYGEEWKLEAQRNVSESLMFLDEVKLQRTGSGKPGVLIVMRDNGKCDLRRVEVAMLDGSGARMSSIDIDEPCEDLYYGVSFLSLKLILMQNHQTTTLSCPTRIRTNRETGVGACKMANTRKSRQREKAAPRNANKPRQSAYPLQYDVVAGL